MTTRRKARNWTIVTALVFLSAGLVLDGSRPQCERAVLVLPRILGLVSDRAADALFAKLATVESAEPVMLVRTSDARSFRVPGGNVQNLWDEVQDGVFAALPPLDAVLIARPYWSSKADDFFREVLAENPGAVPWRADLGGEREVLLLQFGGGVEGLRLQILVEKSGRAWVWMLGPHQEHSWLPSGEVREIGKEVAARAFRFARSSGLPGRSRVVWVCGALDGGVRSFTLATGEGVGRVTYLNSQEPPEDLRSLERGVLEALGISRRGGWFTWSGGNESAG